MDWSVLQDKAEKGPWFEASFPGGETSCCGQEIEPGMTIRADGSGGWEDKGCQE